MCYPYAAKAFIQHEFADDHLNIWLTFALPMNQLVKPDESVWFVEVDDVLYTPASSAWQDAYTLLLVVSDIIESPLRVLVKFDGPDDALETTYKKNWEPWGYILSSIIHAN
jgi:hypothetical protein